MNFKQTNIPYIDFDNIMYSNTGHTTVFISTGNQLTYLMAEVVFFPRVHKELFCCIVPKVE